MEVCCRLWLRLCWTWAVQIPACDRQHTTCCARWHRRSIWRSKDSFWRPLVQLLPAACHIIIIITILMMTTMLVVLSSWPKVLREFTWFIWWMQTERRVAANPQTKPVDLGCESAENWLLPSTSTVAIVIITQPISQNSFYRPVEGGRLSQPRHCSKGAQPVPKAVYRSSCRDKRNRPQCDLNLGPLTPARHCTHVYPPITILHGNAYVVRMTSQVSGNGWFIVCWSFKISWLINAKCDVGDYIGNDTYCAKYNIISVVWVSREIGEM